jgi:hypothetical protein
MAQSKCSICQGLDQLPLKENPSAQELANISQKWYDITRYIADNLPSFLMQSANTEPTVHETIRQTSRLVGEINALAKQILLPSAPAKPLMRKQPSPESIIKLDLSKETTQNHQVLKQYDISFIRRLFTSQKRLKYNLREHTTCEPLPLPQGLSMISSRLLLGFYNSAKSPQSVIAHLKILLMLNRGKEGSLLAVMGFQTSDHFKTDYCVKANSLEDAIYFGGMSSKPTELDQILFMIVKPEKPDQVKEESLDDFMILRVFNVGKDKHRADIIRCKKPTNPNKPRNMMAAKSGGNDFFILASLTNDHTLIMFNCTPASDWYTNLGESSETIDIRRYGGANRNWKVSTGAFDDSLALLDQNSFRYWLLMYHRGQTQLVSFEIHRNPTLERNSNPNQSNKKKYVLQADRDSWRLEAMINHPNVYYKDVAIFEKLKTYIMIGSRTVTTKSGSIDYEIIITMIRFKKQPITIVMNGLSEFSPADVIKHAFMAPDKSDEGHFLATCKNSSKLLYIKIFQNNSEEVEFSEFRLDLSAVNTTVNGNPVTKLRRIQDAVIAPPTAYKGALKPDDPSIVVIDEEWNVIRYSLSQPSTQGAVPTGN